MLQLFFRFSHLPFILFVLESLTNKERHWFSSMLKSQKIAIKYSKTGGFYTGKLLPLHTELLKTSY